MAALEDRFESVQRLLNVVDDVDQQLQLLDARLRRGGGRAAAELAVVATGDPAGCSTTSSTPSCPSSGLLRDSIADL